MVTFTLHLLWVAHCLHMLHLRTKKPTHPVTFGPSVLPGPPAPFPGHLSWAPPEYFFKSSSGC